MKMESFFIGPTDEDITVHLDISMNKLKFIHGTLVDCFEEQSYGKASSELTNTIHYLETMIKHTLIEKDK